MRILLIADEPSKSLWDYYDESKLKGLDLILSAGDLPPEYLSFLVTFANVPLLYVHGNHDTKYQRKPPEGCICIDDKIYSFNGVRILGLGGSQKYSMGAFQYTEKEMEKRVRKLRFPILMKHGFDILLTHSPIRGLGDQEDIPHKGFECFRGIVEKYQPPIMVHGHVHKAYSYDFKRTRQLGQTTIINANEKYVIDFDKDAPDGQKLCLEEDLRKRGLYLG